MKKLMIAALAALALMATPSSAANQPDEALVGLFFGLSLIALVAVEDRPDSN